MAGGIGVNGKVVTLSTSAQTLSQAYVLTSVVGVLKDVNNLSVANPGNTANFNGAAAATNLVTSVAIDSTTVELTFNTIVTSATAQNLANYTIPGLTVSAANMYPTPGTNSDKVRLTTSTHLSNTTSGYVATVTSGIVAAATGGLPCYSPNNTAAFTGDTVPTVQAVASVSSTLVDVVFSEPMLWVGTGNGALNIANYCIETTATATSNCTGTTLAVTLAASQVSPTRVRLTTAGQTLNVLYTVTVNNVKDVTTPTGNTISSTGKTGTFLGQENIKILNATRVADSSSAFAVFKVVFSKEFKIGNGVTTNDVDNMANWSFPAGLNTVTLCTATHDAACPISYTQGIDTTIYFKATPEPGMGAYTVVAGTAVGLPIPTTGSPTGAQGCILPNGGTSPADCLKANPDDRATIDMGLPATLAAGPVYTDPFNDLATVSGQVVQYNGKLLIGPNNTDSGMFQVDINLQNSVPISLDADSVTAGNQAFAPPLVESGGEALNGIDYFYAGCYSTNGAVNTALTGAACTTATGTEYLFVLGYKTGTASGYQSNWNTTNTTSPFIFNHITGLSAYAGLTYRAMSIVIFKGYVYQASQHQNGSAAIRWNRFTPDGTTKVDLSGTYLNRMGQRGTIKNGQAEYVDTFCTTLDCFLISIDTMYEHNNDGGTSRLYIANGGSVRPKQLTLMSRGTFTLTNTISAANGQKAVIGNTTNFLTEVRVGDTIIAGGQTKVVSSITDDTHLSVTANWSPAITAGTSATISGPSDGGILRSVLASSTQTGPPTACANAGDCDGKWEDVTPTSDNWNLYMSKPLPQDAKAGGDWDNIVPANTITPAIKAVPKMATFNGDLYMIRNACSTATVQNITRADSTKGLSGTLAVTNGSATVTGTTTAFTTQLNIGDTITVGGQSRIVLSITSATSLTTTAVWTVTSSGTTFTAVGQTKTCPSGSEIPQLWKLPANSGTAATAKAAWVLVAQNAATGRTDMKGAAWADGTANNPEAANNTELTLLVVNGNRLYIGYNNAVNGLNVWRTKAGITSPSVESDFEAVCQTGSVCSIATKQYGFGGSDKTIFDALSVNDAGTDYLIISARTGIDPLRIYRTNNN
jgi:hypothetical protein